MICLFVWFVSLRPLNNLSVMRDGSSWVEPVLSYDKCVLLKDHNAVTPVRLEPAALRSRVKHSTTEPLRSLAMDERQYNLGKFKVSLRPFNLLQEGHLALNRSPEFIASYK